MKTVDLGKILQHIGRILFNSFIYRNIIFIFYYGRANKLHNPKSIISQTDKSMKEMCIRIC